MVVGSNPTAGAIPHGRIRPHRGVAPCAGSAHAPWGALASPARSRLALPAAAPVCPGPAGPPPSRHCALRGLRSRTLGCARIACSVAPCAAGGCARVFRAGGSAPIAALRPAPAPLLPVVRRGLDVHDDADVAVTPGWGDQAGG